MERLDFYAIDCTNLDKVFVRLNKIKTENFDTHTEVLTRNCPRINTITHFAVELNNGQAISITCRNTSCPLNAKHYGGGHLTWESTP